MMTGRMAQPEPEVAVVPLIIVSENGPYLVRGGVALRNAKGELLTERENYALCRCGQSSNKPFCDGTHKKVGFEGQEAADRGPIERRRQSYRGRGITIFDDRSICAHFGFCTDELPSVWKLGEEPWIDPHGAGAGEIAAQVRRCPSGALAYALGDSAEMVEADDAPAIAPWPDGPYRVVGLPVLRSGTDEFVYEPRARFTLCRCGESRNKPFCDGTHWHIGFTVPDREPDPPQ